MGTTQMLLLCMVVVAHNRCWTADRLAHRGLPHPECCPLCDQAVETVDHLLVLCVSAREFWFRFFSQRTQAFSPQPTETSFHNWWERVSNAASGMIRQGMNSLIILGAWTLWTHRNRCIFYGAAPSISGALVLAEDERKLCLAGGSRYIPLDCPRSRRLESCFWSNLVSFTGTNVIKEQWNC
jgi:hypothetical protein